MEQHIRTHLADVATDYPYKSAVGAILPGGYSQREILIQWNKRDCVHSEHSYPVCTVRPTVVFLLTLV